MKTKLVIIALLVGAQAGLSQGTFQNLNFEGANLVPVLGSPIPSSAPNVPVAYALPGWTVYYGNIQQTVVNFNVVSIGGIMVSLSGLDGGPALDGNYSVLLQAGTPPPTAASISQSGLIPAGTESLLFEASYYGPFEVTIGNEILPLVAVETEPNYTLFGANISEWAGQTEQITFSALPSGTSYLLLDDISFSPSSVPEPSPVVLTGVGGILFGLCRRFAAKRQ